MHRPGFYSQMRYFTTQFSLYFSIFAFLVVGVTGVVVHVAANGTDLAIAGDPFWGLAKWYLLDVHVVFGFFLAFAAVTHLALRLFARREGNRPAERRLVTRIAPPLLAAAACFLLVRCVLDEHPVLVATVRATSYPATQAPDQVVLTWSEAPSTTQTIQWRTSVVGSEGVVRYRPARTGDAAPWDSAQAARIVLEDPYLANDPFNARYTVVLRGLVPGTEYVYQVGDGAVWPVEAEFSTAPASSDAFSFIYMGDVQVGFDQWGNLLDTACERHPDAAFCVMAGDLVNNGVDRNQWDAFFHNSEDVFVRCPLVPALGNHDDDRWGNPWMYLGLFDLPDNGPDGVEPEHAYAFEYENALFVILDSNLPPTTQTAWLEQQMAQSAATWKFVVYHHPFYSSKSHRDNAEIRAEWAPVFDKYGVDIALQGHDHAYLRTYPMRDDVRMSDPAEGVTYVISVAGTKYYEQTQADYAAVAFPEVSTYQVIAIDGGRLTYRAFDTEGVVVDEFVIDKR